MKIRRYKIILLATVIGVSFLCGCSPNKQRVEEAMEKLKSADAIYLQGNMIADLDAGDILGTMHMEMDFYAKSIDEDSWISLRMVTNDSVLSKAGDVTLQQYVIGDKVYAYCQQVSSYYIDCSSMYEKVADVGIGMSLDELFFDVGSTQIKYSESSINYNGNETDVLMAMVMLDNMGMTDLIRNILVRQQASGNVLSGKDMEDLTSTYEDMKVNSAEFVLFIDDDNNIIRFYVKAVLTLTILGQESEYAIRIQYDILGTGDEVTLNFPDMQPKDVISYESLFGT